MAALREQARRRAEGEPTSTYGRQGMETPRALEAALCELEGGVQAFLAPSGLAAISLSLLALVGPGDHVLVTEGVYHPVRKLHAEYLDRIGVQMSYFDPAAGAPEADRAAHELLRSLPNTDDAALQAMADGFRGAEGQARFEVLFERLADQVRLMAEETAGRAEPGSLEPWAQAWESLSNLPGEAEALNLDRADVFWTAMRQLRQAARV